MIALSSIQYTVGCLLILIFKPFSYSSLQYNFHGIMIIVILEMFDQALPNY